MLINVRYCLFEILFALNNITVELKTFLPRDYLIMSTVPVTDEAGTGQDFAVVGILPENGSSVSIVWHFHLPFGCFQARCHSVDIERILGFHTLRKPMRR